MWTTRSSRLRSTASFGCTDCHTDIKAFPHDPTPAKPVCATCHADQQTAYEHGIHAKAAAAGNANVAKCQDCHGSVHEILPASDPKSKVAHVNIPSDLRCLPRQAIGDGVQRSQFRAVHLVRAERARQSGHRRLREGGGLHRLPRRARHPGGHRSEVADRQVQRSGDLRQVPRRRADSSTCRAPTAQAIARGNWQAPVCTDCHGIHTIKAPNDPNSAVAAGNVRNTCGVLPREREALDRIRRRRQPRVVLSVQLSRHGVEGRFDHGRQLRQLPRRAQHSAVQRSAVDHQSRQPGQDLRPVPSGRERQVHHQQSPPRRNHAEGRRRHQGHRTDQQVLHLDDRRRDRRHGAAQPDRLPQETDAAPHRAAADSVPHDAGAAGPAPDAADQLLHPGADRLRAAVSVVVAGDGVRQRAGAQL